MLLEDIMPFNGSLSFHYRSKRKEKFLIVKENELYIKVERLDDNTAAVWFVSASKIKIDVPHGFYMISLREDGKHDEIKTRGDRSFTIAWTGTYILVCDDKYFRFSNQRQSAISRHANNRYENRNATMITSDDVNVEEDDIYDKEAEDEVSSVIKSVKLLDEDQLKRE